MVQGTSISQNCPYAKFCKLAASDDEIFQTFKRHSSYQEVLEHVSYEVGLQYLDIIVNEYPELINHFDKFRKNDSLGNPNIYHYGKYGWFSPTTLRYIKTAGDLKKRFGKLSNLHIVEIGGGYGGLCKIISDLDGFASYTIIDLPESNQLARKYLGKSDIRNLFFIDNHQLSKTRSYNLVISNYAFSEIDQVEQAEYIKHVIKPTPNGYMTMNFTSPHYNLTSMPIQELTSMLQEKGRIVKLEKERPLTAPDNLLLTWENNLLATPSNPAKSDDPTLSQTSLSQPSILIEKPFVIASVYGQLGNNFFEIATACALAWDHNADPYFPDLLTNKEDNIPLNHEHVFFRCKTNPPSRSNKSLWFEPTFAYHSIPFQPNMHIKGYFQSEKYFKHHRDKLLELFAPRLDDLAHIENKYKKLLEHPKTVGIQIRYYRVDDPTGKLYNQYGKEYLDKAMSHFPKDSLFIVSSNNLEFARQNIPSWAQNVVYLEGEPHYIDLFILSLCKHNIITNSSFGWWAAWLNKNPNKIVIAPKVWVNPNWDLPTQDVLPETWTKLDTDWIGMEK